MAETIIEVKNISFSYGADSVLSNVSFDVMKGDYIGLIGPNGAGKTTLLKIMLGLLTPADGSVSFFGEDVKKFKDWAKIGYVPQKATNFDINFPATVEEVVLMGRYARRGLFNKLTPKDRSLMKSALERVEMHKYKGRLVGQLSGGEQQRVFIARALAAEPEIIFLDEPTVGVDQKTRNEFYALLRKLNKDLSLTLILVSHDVSVVANEANRIICIDRDLVCNSSPKEFLADSRLGELFRGDVGIITHKHHHQ